MKKYLCLLILVFYSLLLFSESKMVEATEVDKDMEFSSVGHLYLPKEIYNVDDIIQLEIYVDSNNRDITDITFNGVGFELYDDYVVEEKVCFSIVYVKSTANPCLEIFLEIEDEIIELNLFGKVFDGLLFINPYSYKEAEEVYMQYLKQNNNIKYEQIQSQLKPITHQNNTNNTNYEQSNFSLTDTADTFLSGQFQWIDDDSNIHPLQFVKVQLWDKEPVGERLLMETITNEAGEYHFEFKNATEIFDFENGGYDIFVRVTPTGDDVIVCRGNGSSYYADEGYCENCPTGVLEDISETYDMSDGEFGKSLQVCQAAIFASKYYEEMKGQDVDDILIKYPHNEQESTSFYRTSEKTIYLVNKINVNNDLPNSYAAWDVIMHEYGHHIANSENFTNSPGGRHSLNRLMSSHYLEHFIGLNRDCNLDCIIEKSDDWPFGETDCKYQGMAIAWSEGVATYFMLAAQEFYSQYLTNIDTVNDKSYTSYSISTVELEEFIGYFHDNEKTVASILYDMYDGNDSEDFDAIELGHQVMFEFITGSSADTFFEFYEYFIENFNGNRTVFSRLGHLLYNCQFSTTSPTSTSEITYMCPTFNWTWVEPIHDNYNYNNYFTDRSFALKFYDENMNYIYQVDEIDSLSYTLTENQWAEILNMRTNFYVSVLIYENGDPLTYYESSWTFYEKPEIDTLYHNKVITKTFEGNDFYWFEYTATESGQHTIESIGIHDTLGDVFSGLVVGDSTVGLIAYDDDGGENYNFKIIINLYLGQTIYIKVSSYRGEGVGDFGIKLTSANHIHEYTHSFLQFNTSSHHAYCECGVSTLESHSYIAYKNGHKCQKCSFFTTGAVINPIKSKML